MTSTSTLRFNNDNWIKTMKQKFCVEAKNRLIITLEENKGVNMIKVNCCLRGVIVVGGGVLCG